MSNYIDVNLLSKTVQDYLEDYTEDIGSAVEEVANKVGKEAVEELKETSPRGKTKKYYKGWTLKKDKLGKNKYSVKIWNKTSYQLTHLLEFGHATRNGKHTKAIPHIRPVEKKYSTKFEEELKSKIGGKL